MKTFIFDMDGLMFDTERVYIEACNHAGERTGFPDAGTVALGTLGMTVELSNRIWKEAYGIDFGDSVLREEIQAYIKRYYQENPVPVKKGLYELLDYLMDNSCKLAVASSTERRIVLERLENAGVRDYFQIVLGGDTIGHSKPEPDIYLEACRQLGEKPETCYVLEDSRNGILAGSSAGCRVIMIPDLWEPDEDILRKVTAKFDDLGQVKEALEMGRL